VLFDSQNANALDAQEVNNEPIHQETVPIQLDLPTVIEEEPIHHLDTREEELVRPNDNCSDGIDVCNNVLLKGCSVGAKTKKKIRKNLNKQLERVNELLSNDKKVFAVLFSSSYFLFVNNYSFYYFANSSDTQTFNKRPKVQQENVYKKQYRKRINYKSDLFILEFVNGVVINPVNNLKNLRLIDETDILISNSLSKRIILLFDKFIELQVDIKKFFSEDAYLCLVNSIDSSRNQAWLCSVCEQDSCQGSIGCDYCNNWFHFGCVGLDKSFVGSFFCQSCLSII